MWSLRWKWEDGKDGYCVGDSDSLATVYISLTRYYPQLQFTLTSVKTGSEVLCHWLKREHNLIGRM